MYSLFCQAEDGIRDIGMTGVQTCALPISLHRLLNDLLDAWEDTGIYEFILLTAHGHDPHQEALATVITTDARVRVVDIFAIDVADLLEGQTEPMHGDEVDTSIDRKSVV